MISTHEMETRFNYLDDDRLNTLIEIHNIVAEIAPCAAVDIHRKGLTYFDALRGGHVSAGICQTLIEPDGIHLAFIHGALLDDPKSLMEGNCLVKRYVCIKSFETAPWEDLKKLIITSNQYDPRLALYNH